MVDFSGELGSRAQARLASELVSWPTTVAPRLFLAAATLDRSPPRVLDAEACLAKNRDKLAALGATREASSAGYSVLRRVVPSGLRGI